MAVIRYENQSQLLDALRSESPSERNQAYCWIFDSSIALPKDMSLGQATKVLFREGAAIRAWAIRMRLPPDQADDIVQATAMDLLRYSSRLNEVSNLRGWMWKTARRRWLDLYRRNKRFPSLLESESDEDDTQERAVADVVVTAWQAAHSSQGPVVDEVGALSFWDCIDLTILRFKKDFPTQGELIDWYIHERFSQAEMAEKLGKKAGAFREYLSAAKERYRRYAAQCDPDGDIGLTGMLI